MNLYANLSKDGETIFISAGENPPQLHDLGVPCNGLLATFTTLNVLSRIDIAMMVVDLGLERAGAPVAMRLERKDTPQSLVAAIAKDQHKRHILESAEKVQRELESQR